MVSAFNPVTTLDELDALDAKECLDGYTSAERGDPEPGPNHTRAYWHDWRCRQMDYGELPIPPEPPFLRVIHLSERVHVPHSFV